ncbi:IclR family transcriptional regulator [Planococcus beigongshangi]|uniref:IclR family transcriptional regulator n=1 Tax=Planococcus beigongshangi TaxID=2782536 RepID=UPI00193C5BA2|nr:IclR family transcriptional regulator [Planococcus beigongshangi]
MTEKYWVPAIAKADNILTIISEESKGLRLMEIAERSNLNKSTLFSLLNTLERIGWVAKANDQTYSLGAKLGFIGSKYIHQFDLTTMFNREAEKTVRIVGETIQLSILDEREIIYLAKKNGTSRVRVATEPGMRFPAHATAMGKVMLSAFTKDELKGKYGDCEFEKFTDYTVDNLNDLFRQLDALKKSGYLIESQEAVKGFTCIASPILNERSAIIAAVSITMDNECWSQKKDLCIKEILTLSQNLSIMG